MPVIPQITPSPSAKELEVQRLNTTAFIAANPSLIILTPRSRNKTGSGATWVQHAPRVAQVVRLIDQTASAAPETAGASTQSGDGFQRKQQHQLLLPYDGEVGMYDFWIDAEGVRWEVSGILPANGYEVRAEVTRLGQTRQS